MPFLQPNQQRQSTEVQLCVMVLTVVLNQTKVSEMSGFDIHVLLRGI